MWMRRGVSSDRSRLGDLGKPLVLNINNQIVVMATRGGSDSAMADQKKLRESCLRVNTPCSRACDVSGIYI